MPKLTQYTTDAATIAGSVEALFGLYQQLEPGAKALIEAEAQKAAAEFTTIKTAVAAFKSASVFGKVSAGITLLSSVLDIGSFLQTLYTDGEKYFGASWPQVMAEVNTIKAVFITVPTAPTVAISAAPIAVTAPVALPGTVEPAA